MITLITILTLYGLISLVRTYLATRKRGTPFDLEEAPTVYDFLGVLVLITLILSVFLIPILDIIVKYLP